MHHEFLSSLAPLSVALPLAEGPFLCTPSDATRTLIGLLPSLVSGQSVASHVRSQMLKTPFKALLFGFPAVSEGSR